MTNQRHAKKFVKNHVFLCLTGWVEELMKTDTQFYEDLIEVSIRRSSYLDTLLNYGWEVQENPVNRFDDRVILVNPSEGLIWDNTYGTDLTYTDLTKITENCLMENEDQELESIAETIANRNRIEQDEMEALEFWAVSDYLALQLDKEGHSVKRILGANVWGRTTSGQAIAMDGVIERIANRCDTF